jgi:D-alanine-D-alanine ligase
MIKLGIIFGGRSGEHEVSLLSAASVIRAVDKTRYSVVMIGITKQGRWLLYDGSTEAIEDGSWQEIAETALKTDEEGSRLELLGEGPGSLKNRIDFALPILHGPYGEDGTIQGLFEMIDIPYGGCGVAGSALAMDKILAKRVFEQGGLPQGLFIPLLAEELVEDWEGMMQKIEAQVSYPVFVKPANLGSSVGITKAKNREEMKAALSIAMEHDRRLLVEQGIDCREIEAAVLGNHRPEASVLGEIIPSAEFYDYTAKYLDGGKSRLCIPADLPEKVVEEVRRIAVEAYQLLDCCGFARVDFFVERGTNQIFLNEINTIPGFTKFRMFPLLWGAAGLAYPDLIERIITLGYERYHAKNSRQAALRLR